MFPAKNNSRDFLPPWLKAWHIGALLVAILVLVALTALFGELQ